MEKFSKKVFYIGSLSYLVLALLAFIFYKERTIMFDMAFHTFEIVRTSTFAIQCLRFGAVVTQWVPLLAVKMGLPLKEVLISYSLAFVLFPFICFLTSILYFKNWKIALAILLYNTLLVAHTFYWIQSEIMQGCVFLLLFYAFLLQKEDIKDFNLIEKLIYLIMIITIAFFHPLIAIPFFYLALFFLLSNWNHKSKLLIVTMSLFTIVLIGKQLIFPPTGYDAGRLSSLKLFKEFFPDYITLKTNIYFLKYCLSDYYFLPPLFAIVVVFYILSKKYLKLTLVLAFFFGYLLLIDVTSMLWTEQLYVESFYLCLGIFLCIPLIFDILPTVKNPNYAVIAIAVILMVRLTHIAITHKNYSERVAWYETLIKNTAHRESKKIIVSEKDVPMETLKLSWGSSFELLLLSSMNSADSSRCIIIDEDIHRFDRSNRTSLYTEWSTFSYDDLPRNYFNLKDTTQYQILDH